MIGKCLTNETGRYIHQLRNDYSKTIPTPATTAVTAYIPNCTDPTPITLGPRATPAPCEDVAVPDALDPDASAAVGWEVTVPVPADPA